VFVQWLECVWLILVQFPSAFEFTPAILLKLSNEVFSNRYGTFLCDFEQERHNNVMPFTISLWADLLHPETLPSWRNPSYERRYAQLVPNVNQASYVIWEAYWFRFHARSAQLKKNTTAIDEPALAAPAATGGYLAEAVGTPAAATAPCSTGELPVAAATSDDAATLFKPEELSAPSAPAVEPARNVFADDDEDEDVFADKLRKTPVESSAGASGAAAADQASPAAAATMSPESSHLPAVAQSDLHATVDSQESAIVAATAANTATLPEPPPFTETADGEAEVDVGLL
jgi:hypothetical protein